MTPKEKAVDMTSNQCGRLWEFAFELNIKPTPIQVKEKAKQCALICVDEILACDLDYEIWHGDLRQEDFWKQVKTEIEKL